VNIENDEEKTLMDADQKECPFCAEVIKAKAIKCRFCGENLEEIPVQTQTKSPSKVEPTKSSRKKPAGKKRTVKKRSGCPICSSSSIIKANVAISSGSYTGVSTGAGLGISSSGSIGVGVGKTKTAQQSEFSKNIKTADEKNCAEEFGGYVGSFFGLILGILVGFSSESFIIGFVVMLSGTMIGMIMGKNTKMGRAETERIQVDKMNFDDTWVCNSCGHQFIKN
jgi:hypothetical protein